MIIPSPSATVDEDREPLEISLLLLKHFVAYYLRKIEANTFASYLEQLFRSFFTYILL